jgi:tetratricopeptide (TPR) repeat protein
MKNLKIKYLPIILIAALSVFGCKNHIEQYYDKGYNQYNTGDFKGAVESFTKYIESGKNVKYRNAAIIFRATSYFGLNDADIAFKELDSLINNLPKSNDELWNCYYVRSCLYGNQKKYREAIADLDIVLQSDMPMQMREVSIGYRALYKYNSGDFIGAKVDSFVLKKNYNGNKKTYNDFLQTLPKGN